MRRMFLTWSVPVSQFPIGETRATTTARSNSYHAREVGDIGLRFMGEWWCPWSPVSRVGRLGFCRPSGEAWCASTPPGESSSSLKSEGLSAYSAKWESTTSSFVSFVSGKGGVFDSVERRFKVDDCVRSSTRSLFRKGVSCWTAVLVTVVIGVVWRLW